MQTQENSLNKLHSCKNLLHAILAPWLNEMIPVGVEAEKNGKNAIIPIFPLQIEATWRSSI